VKKSYQHNLGLVKLLLDLHNSVGLPGILVPLQVAVDFRELCCRVGIVGTGNFGCKVVQNLGEKRESHPGRILLIGNNDG